MSLVLGFGLEHSCPWPREGLIVEGLSLVLVSDFFVSLAVASSLVFSTHLWISLLGLPGKVYAKCLERKYREIVESKLENGQCGFCSGCNATHQIFTLKQIFEKSWEYGINLSAACFVDLEKAFDRVPRDKLWKVLQEYGVDGQWLRAIKSFY